MSYLIAVSGKGGVGKTTVAGLLITRLIARKCRPVLAVDADPNSCLDAVLGVRVEKTVGGVREEAREIASQGMSSGISKQQLLQLKIEESLVETDDFDLIAMGRPEGPGCYCFANNVLKSALSQISLQYPYTVLDNEAGLENLSRRIVQKVDLLVMVADPSHRGLETIRRLHSLTREMKIEYDHLAVVVNRLRRAQLPEKALEFKNELGADSLIGLPDNEELAEFAEDGKSLLNLSDDNPVSVRLDQFLTDLRKFE
ncbi:MAG: AAA family ATPase [Proteobacteria bacterium]|nr:AAA family ATPase [Pseudomonadota bacterium]